MISELIQLNEIHAQIICYRTFLNRFVRTKELAEEVQEKVVNLYEAGFGNKKNNKPSLEDCLEHRYIHYLKSRKNMAHQQFCQQKAIH